MLFGKAIDRLKQAIGANDLSKLSKEQVEEKNLWVDQRTFDQICKAHPDFITGKAGYGRSFSDWGSHIHTNVADPSLITYSHELDKIIEADIDYHTKVGTFDTRIDSLTGEQRRGFYGKVITVGPHDVVQFIASDIRLDYNFKDPDFAAVAIVAKHGAKLLQVDVSCADFDCTALKQMLTDIATRLVERGIVNRALIEIPEPINFEQQFDNTNVERKDG